MPFVPKQYNIIKVRYFLGWRPEKVPMYCNFTNYVLLHTSIWTRMISCRVSIDWPDQWSMSLEHMANIIIPSIHMNMFNLSVSTTLYNHFYWDYPTCRFVHWIGGPSSLQSSSFYVDKQSHVSLVWQPIITSGQIPMVIELERLQSQFP